MRRYFIHFIYLFYFSAFCQAQIINTVSKNDSIYSNPLSIPLILAGNFGELRSNHFHAGLDLKTQQQEGLAIKSIADGYVSRIKISHWGYGKALYIKHPNGVSAVYAHLQKFSPEIEDYINKKQYLKKSFTLEVFPKKNELNVFKDSLIAYSGNTGGSTAPHLHFEMRTSGTAIAQNPLQFKNKIIDKTPPVLEKLFVYPKEGFHVNRSEKKTQISFKIQGDGTYIANEIKANGGFYIGVKAFDRQDLAANKNGVYRYKLYKNDNLIAALTFNEFSFNETRNINNLIDYEHLILNKERVVILKENKAFPLRNLKTTNLLGLINANPYEKSKLALVLEDFSGNTTTVYISLSATTDNALIKKPIIKTPYPIYFKNPAHFKFTNASVYFPAKAFYSDQYLEISEKKDSIRIHHNKVPLNKNFTLSFKPNKSGYSSYSYIAYHLSKNVSIYSATKNENGWLTTNSNKLGTYTIKQDSIPPSIKPRNFKANQQIKNYQYLSFTIKDQETGIKSYEAHLNGEWILMEYEPKNNSLTHHFKNQNIIKKTNLLEVTVTDMLNNSSTFSTTLKL